MTSIVNFLLCLLISVHLVKCDLESLFEKCCRLGKNKALETLKCESKIRTPIPEVTVEQQGICLSVVDLCCIQHLRENACTSGKWTAKQNRNCNIVNKTDEDITYKYCCESCKLGMITKSMSMDCKPRNFDFRYPWQEVYETCCEEYTVAPIITTRMNSPTLEPVNICELLRGELCSQICVPVGGSYKCQCRSGFVLMADGKSCKADNLEDRCEKFKLCDQKCFDNGESIECSCDPGYELLADNRTCVDINECNLKIDDCYASGQICRNTKGGYECVGNSVTMGVNEKPTTLPTDCLIGYRYDIRNNYCSDIDECNERNPCDNTRETCLNTPGSYRCLSKVTNQLSVPQSSRSIPCRIGYLFDNRTNSCVDYNECKEEDPCSSYEICENQIGSFNCKCKMGFERDTLTGACVDINECQLRRHNCESTQRCDNTIGSYQCHRNSPCGTGYTLNAQTGDCEDDDECALGMDDCKKMGPDWVCRNIIGSFRCERKRCVSTDANCIKVTSIKCPLGYESYNEVCRDIDECKRKNLCRSDETCLNTDGGYSCIRKPNCNSVGLRYNQDQTQCIDIDECKEQPTVCDHRCINTWGSFKCICNDGYTLHNDSRSCIDINECEMFKHVRLCLGICANTPGSYKCQCPDGYVLDVNGKTCNDINECSTHVCNKPDEICVNTRGSYRCNTIPCPPNYQRDPANNNRCIRTTNFCLVDRDCSQKPLSYTFSYLTLPSNTPMPMSGQYNLFKMSGPSSRKTATYFSMDMKDVHAPEEIEKVTKNHFLLNYPSANEAIVSLIRSIQGPQDIELNLKMEFFTDGKYNGFSLHKLFIYVSQYDF